MTISRRQIAAIVCVCSVAILVIAYLMNEYDSNAPNPDWPQLQPAVRSDEPVEIQVARNVPVSSSEMDGGRWECVAAAHPSDPAKLYAAVMLKRHPPNVDVAVFYSHDGGDNWHVGCHEVSPGGHAFGDPTIAVGPEGEVYLAYMDVDRAASTFGKEIGSVEFLASTDDGQTWEKRSRYAAYVDRPWLAVDTLSAKYSGRVYCLGQVEGRDAEDRVDYAKPLFLRSADRLKNMSEPVFPHLGRTMVNCRPSNPVVLADGSLFVAYMDRYVKRKIRQWPRPAIYTARSTDGGQSFRDRAIVNTQWWHSEISSSPESAVGAEFPQLAADTAGRFAGRVYCVWPDGSGDDGTRIFFSCSPDYGGSWSQAVVLSEQAMSPGSGGGYLSFVPSVAVNKDGVVAVSWYDRRGLPNTTRLAMPDSPGVFQKRHEGWNVRLRVSLDGGATWQPSVQINEQAGHGDVNVGHTAGLIAAADGRFHATWIDNRRGKNELWSAVIRVRAGTGSR